MARLWIFFLIINIVLTAAALISCLSAEDEEIRGLPRLVWVLIILLFSPVAAIVWFLMGRERGHQARRTWRPGNGFPEHTRPQPTAPDDDPDFLRKLGQEQKKNRADDEDLLRKWEEDLKRREEELRKKPDESGDTER